MPSHYKNRNTPFGTQVGVKLNKDDLELLDLWIAANAPDVGRPEALRRILRLVALRIPRGP
ncbi:hypothetical protein HNO88_004250 [Novosphingobium chloroacetimidivorans]|uniref:Uncharacterized protein n=1 Tax=Novosphingobium chloroacetimidivorans TaxID=1428314 RepID=A0A7W7KER8_9SPHN|nr:hypothetical protein [Novosphingobium chloroacetimidivorans]